MNARPRPPSPFEALGLPASRELTGDDVRAAWRRIAAATHPDRADGGDPERFALASAAYAALRTSYGRGELLADLEDRRVTATRSGPPPAPPVAAPPVAAGAAAAAAPAPRAAFPEAGPAPAPARAAPSGPSGAATHPDAEAHAPALLRRGGWTARLLWRIRRGRPAVLALRVAIAAAAGAVAVAAVGFAPSALALITGAATWLALTVRNDLAPPGPR